MAENRVDNSVDKDSDKEDQSSVDEENDDEEEHSSHGETTDDEMEIVYYWEGLESGVLAYPAPLKTQCLLFLVGDIISHYDSTEVVQPWYSNIHLIPHSIRRQLLLLLPAIDVCRLEGTQMTKGISMDEIWELLFKERFPYHCNKKLLDDLGIVSPEELEREKQISCTWKDVYFDGVFAYQQGRSYYLSDLVGEDCECVYSHFLPELLFGIYSVNGEMEVYRCFSEAKTYSCHGVCRYAHKCPRLTPQRYSHEFYSPTIPERRSCESVMSMYSVVDILVTVCNCSLYRLFLTPFHCEELWQCMNSLEFTETLSTLLSSVQSISMSRLQNIEAAKKLLDIIFSKSNCAVKHMMLNDSVLSFYYARGQEQTSIISVIHPYLTKLGKCMLKQLEVHFNTASKYEADMIEILKHHQSLEKVTFHICTEEFTFTHFNYNAFIQLTADLLHRSVLKKLIVNFCQVRGDVSSDVFFALLRQFLSSPHPVSLAIQRLKCPKFDAFISPFNLDIEQHSKSLELERCSFSLNLSSLLPKNLVLDTLDLKEMDYNTLQSFADLESIKVESFTLSFQNLITVDNVNDVCKLMSIVTAQEWNLDLCINEKSPVDSLAAAMSRFARFVRRISFQGQLSLIIFETIFNALSCKPPSFEFSFSLFYDSNEDLIKEVYALWVRFGSIKLKKIRLFVNNKGGVPVPLMNIVSEMAVEVYTQ